MASISSNLIQMNARNLFNSDIKCYLISAPFNVMAETEVYIYIITFETKNLAYFVQHYSYLVIRS